MSERIQLWSCGGGRQSAGIAALIVQGRLPRPDHIAMSALKGEKRTTWEYVCGVIRPAMRSLGIPFTIVPSVKYATKGFFGGEDGITPLMPVYTNQSGEPGKLSEWCSGGLAGLTRGYRGRQTKGEGETCHEVTTRFARHRRTTDAPNKAGTPSKPVTCTYPLRARLNTRQTGRGSGGQSERV